MKTPERNESEMDEITKKVLQLFEGPSNKRHLSQPRVKSNRKANKPS